MFAIALAAFLLVLATRNIVNDVPTGWLFATGIVPHRWLVVMNAAIYGWICWIAFWCVRGTVGRERLFMVGLLGNLLLWPLRMLFPHWAIAIHYIRAFGFVAAVVAAFTLLHDFSIGSQPTTPA